MIGLGGLRWKKFQEKYRHKSFLRVHVYDGLEEMYYDMMPNTLYQKDGRATFDVGEKTFYLDKGALDKDIDDHVHLRFDKNDAEPIPILGRDRPKLVDSSMLWIQFKKEVLKAKYGRATPDNKLPYIIAVAAIVGMVVVIYIISGSLQGAVTTVTTSVTNPPISVVP
jgi:hypothetical protein